MSAIRLNSITTKDEKENTGDDRDSNEERAVMQKSKQKRFSSDEKERTRIVELALIRAIDTDARVNAVLAPEGARRDRDNLLMLITKTSIIFQRIT